MALRDLLAKFQIVTNPEALDKVNVQLDKTKEKFSRLGPEASASLEQIKSAAELVKHALEAFIGFEVIKHVGELTEKYAKLGQELKVTSESLGLNVEKFQTLVFVAGQSAVSQEQLSHSLLRLSRALYEAKTGSIEAQNVFAHLGVPPGQIQQLKGADEALLLLSTRLQTIQNPIDKLALVQKTLGRGSMEMVAFLSQGPAAIQAKMAAAARDGLVLSESQVNGLEKMNHALEHLEAKLRVIVASLIEPLSPIVSQLVEDFIHFFNANKAWIDLNVEGFVRKVAFALGFLDGFIGTFVTNLRKHFPEGGLLGGLFGDLIIGGGLVLALSGITAALSFMASAAAAVATTLLPIVLAVQAIHDLYILFAGEGSFAERLQNTWTAKEVDWVTGKINAQTPTERATSNSAAFGGALGGLASGVGGPLAGAAAGAIFQNVFHIHGASDPHATATVVAKKIDEQNRRDADRAVSGNIRGSK